VLVGIAVVLLFKYPELTGYDNAFRNTPAVIILLFPGTVYLAVQYLRKRAG
jgi:hypothetical protein